MQDLITVATGTVGNDSYKRLDIFFSELKKYTSVGYRHVVCDDGTLDEAMVARQREVCAAHGVEHFANPGPYGVSHNLNHLLEQVRTPWVFLVEDGLRPSVGWMEAALSFVEAVHGRSFLGHEIGMAGTSHIQDWTLRMAGAIPSNMTVMEYFRGADVGEFYGDWNDGTWCWNRLLPGLRAACLGDTSDWENEVAVMKQIVLHGLEETGGLYDPKTGEILCSTEQEQYRLKFRTRDHWPVRRTAGVGWYPGAFMLVNMDKWRQVGRFRDGCTFFEGHLGIRMGMAGHVVTCLEFPPWLHCPSLGFKASGEAKTPRDHRDTDSIFREDFGGRTHMNAVDLPNQVISMFKQSEINLMLRDIKCKFVPEWEKYLNDPVI